MTWQKEVEFHRRPSQVSLSIAERVRDNKFTSECQSSSFEKAEVSGRREASLYTTKTFIIVENIYTKRMQNAP